MTIWPKNLFKAETLIQKFITSYKIDPKIYFPAKKLPSNNGTSSIPIYGSYPPPPPEGKAKTHIKPGFHYMDYMVEQSYFTLIALFWLEIGRCRKWLNGNQALISHTYLKASWGSFHFPKLLSNPLPGTLMFY